MCMQCMATAMGSGAVATGARSWLATRRWLTPRRLKACTISLLAGALLASATLVSGSGSPPPPAKAISSAPTAQAR